MTIDNDRYALKGLSNLRNITVAKEKLRLWPGGLLNDIGDAVVEDASTWFTCVYIGKEKQMWS